MLTGRRSKSWNPPKPKKVKPNEVSENEENKANTSKVSNFAEEEKRNDSKHQLTEELDPSEELEGGENDSHRRLSSAFKPRKSASRKDLENDSQFSEVRSNENSLEEESEDD